MWTYNDAEKVAGGIYLFDSKERVRAWGDGAVQAVLGEEPGVTNVQTNYYDIDEKPGAVTSRTIVARLRARMAWSRQSACCDCAITQPA